MAHRAVYKTTTAEFLDDFYSGEYRPREDAYADALALMEQSAPLSEAARDLENRNDGALAPGSTDAFLAGWLEESAKHGEQPVDRVLREGYRLAVERATPRKLPIENFWVTGASDEFEVHVCESRDRVTVFMFVPAEDERPYGSESARSTSWVVRVGDIDVRPDAPRTERDDVMTIQVSGDFPTSGA